MNEKTFITREALGMLTIPGTDKSYFLLAPYPVEADSWQHYNERRFTVVPAGIDNAVDHSNNEYRYSYARHIVVSGPFVLESMEPREIKILKVKNGVEELEKLNSDDENYVLENLFNFYPSVPEQV